MTSSGFASSPPAPSPPNPTVESTLRSSLPRRARGARTNQELSPTMPTSSRPREAVAQIRRVAQERFGFDALRAGQLEPIRAVLAGQDTLAVLPTGAGKSAIYQIAASLLPGPTVVVSPLIALQRDQVESLEGTDIGEAAVVNSTMAESERREALQELKEGELEFLFLAPEQLGNEKVFKRLKAVKPSLFVV